MQQMENDKVPGPDGLPIEFYKFFLCKIKNLLFDAIKEMSEQGLTIDEGCGVISLMEKTDCDPLYLKHWCPLTMLNSDAKIYSKVLADRLYTVTDKIIHHDHQVSFQKGRYIGKNLLDLTSLLEYCDKKQVEALLIAIDFQRAFDSVTWVVYYDTLRCFGVGEQYIKYVQNLFTNITSCTVNNRFASEWISLERGLCQGCCYSPPAFLVIIETLGVKIRQEEKIEGIQCGHITKKHTQFADDLWAIIKAKQQVIDTFFEVLKDFN